MNAVPNFTKEEQQQLRSKDLSYYSKDEPTIPPRTREVFEQYSKIHSDQVVAHVQSIREKAWDIFPYPCVGTYRFLDLAVCNHPHYDTLVKRIAQPGTLFFDLGCAFGQDIRRLVYDGVPSDNCWAADLQLPFINLGYDLFLDKATLKATFFEADVFDESETAALRRLDGRVDVLQASAFFHLFDYDTQKKIARQVVKLLKPDKGAILFGQHAGHIDAGRHKHNAAKDAYMYRHNADSWQQFWDEVGAETGTKWTVETELRPLRSVSTLKYHEQNKDRDAEGARWVMFTVTRQ